MANSSELFVEIHGKKCPVLFNPAVTKEEHVNKAINYSPFQDWLSGINSDQRFVVKKIEFQGIDMFGPRVGFIKFKADIVNEEGSFLPGIVFMRGGAVTMLVILECEGEEYGIITLQPRVPTGKFAFPELPAGMLDGSGNFSGVAAAELREECGIVISSTDLLDMTELVYGGTEYKGVYPSAGGCDEFIRIFLFRKKVEKAELQTFQGRLTGDLKNGEKITLKIVPLDQLYKHAPDMKALSALFLHDKLKQQGLLPTPAGKKE
jgi:ADP-sugar diphosphatase